jgi:lipopolysaccharide export system permease protein
MKLAVYLAKTVFLTSLLVLLFILSIDFVFGLIGQIKAINPAYPWSSAVLYILYRLPLDLTLVFPIVAFLGALIGLSMLAAKSELIAMRAAGFSLFDLARAMMLTAGGFLVVYYSLTLFLAPYARHLSLYQQSTFSRSENVLVLSSQTWLKSGNHFLLMGQILPEGEINQLTDFVVINGALTQVRQVESVKLTTDHLWTLHHVVDTTITPRGIEQQRQDEITEPSLISKSLLPVIAMQPDEMIITTLASYINFREQNHLDIKQYKLQFWNRLLSPLMLPIMMLLAIPFVLGSLRSGTHVRLILGMSLGFCFYIISQFFGSLTLLSPLSPFLGALIPIVFFGSLASFLFYWVALK